MKTPLGRLACLVALALSGCPSPEDGRPRSDGHGGDGANYPARPVHAPSKIDGTRSWSTPPTGR